MRGAESEGGIKGVEGWRGGGVKFYHTGGFGGDGGAGRAVR